MMTERYRYFKWTPRTTWITFAYVIAFPALIGYIGYTTDVSCLVFDRIAPRDSWSTST